MNRSLPERNSQHRNAALAAASAATDAITLPLVSSVLFATGALVAIAVNAWRLRRAARLTGVTAAASGVSSAGILACALLESVALGGSPVALAKDASLTGIPQRGVSGPSAVAVSPGVDPPPTGDSSGPQLGTK